MSTRDTQFAGFAKMVYEEMRAQAVKEVMQNRDVDHTQNGTAWSESVTKIITERAYDLVRHACEEIAVYEGYGRSGGHSLLEEIPDMTEFSGGVQ